MTLRRTATVLALAALLGAGGAGARGQQQELVIGLTVIKHGKQVLALVPVTINGKGPYTFALDTGASQSLVDSGVAKELSVQTTGASHQVAGTTDGTSGQPIRGARWQVGKVALPATTVVEATLPFGNADGGV